MLMSLAIGAVAGLRSMTPMAATAVATRLQAPLPGVRNVTWTGAPLITAGAVALFIGELLGDKMKSAPDRTVPPGLAARLITGSVAGAALAPPERRTSGAVAGAAAAVAAGYAGLAIRKRAMKRFGQTPSGLVEDALAISAAALLFCNAGAFRRAEGRKTASPR